MFDNSKENSVSCITGRENELTIGTNDWKSGDLDLNPNPGEVNGRALIDFNKTWKSMVKLALISLGPTFHPLAQFPAQPSTCNLTLGKSLNLLVP